MIRRDFFKALTAFTAAVAAGVRMPSGRDAEAALQPPPSALEKVAPPPPPPAPIAQAMSMQDQVMAWLVEFDVIGYEAINVIDGYTRYRVTYQMDKIRGRRSSHFNEQVRPLIEGKRPVSVSVHATGRDVDITSFGEFGARMVEPVYEIEVTWA